MITTSYWPSLNCVFWGLIGIVCLTWCKKRWTDSESTENSLPLSSEDAGQHEDTRVFPNLEKKNAVIHILKEQKVELKAHREQLTQQLERNEEEKKENKMNLQQVETKPGLLKEKEDLLKVTWKLDEQQREYEKSRNRVDQMLQNINTLLAIVAE